MMHNSEVIYETVEAKKISANIQLTKRDAKTKGSYFQAPLIQKTLSTKPYAFRNVIRAVVEQYQIPKQQKQGNKQAFHYLDITPYQSTTMKLLNMKNLEQKKNGVTKAFRWQYRVNVKQYLKRKYMKETYELPLEAFQVLRYVDKKEKDKQFYKTKHLYIFKPFHINDNLKRKIQTYGEEEKKFFKAANLYILFRQLIKCHVEFGGLDGFLMTSSNVYMEQDMRTLQINYTSFAGVALIKCESPVGAHEFFQIFPYLTKDMLESKQIRLQDRIRSFLIICLCLIKGKDITLDLQNPVEAQKYFDYNQIKTYLEKQTLKTQIKKQIDSISNKKSKTLEKVGIINLIDRGILKNQKLTWGEIMRNICIGDIPKKVKKEKGKKEESEQKQTQLQEAENNNIPVSEGYGNFIEVNFKKFHEQMYNEEQDKNYYITRGIHQELLYIPVKFRGDLNLIFDKKAWWEIFNIKDSQGKVRPELFCISHENFCLRLLKTQIDRYEKKQPSLETARQFMSDPIIEILIAYLQASQFPIYICNFEKLNTETIENYDFSKDIRRYCQLKQKMQKLTKSS